MSIQPSASRQQSVPTERDAAALDYLNARQIFDKSGIGYAITDRSLKVTGASENLCSVYDEVHPPIGRHLLEIAPELVGSEDQLAEILAGECSHMRVQMVNRDSQDGRVIYLNLTVLPHLHDEESIDGLIFVTEDITDMARIEQAVSQHRNELTLLRDQLSLQNLQISAANAELHRLDEIKSEFVSIAAHELRSPLSTISGYLDLLNDVDFGRLTEQQSQFTAAIERGVQRLTDTIDDLLDVTRIAAGRMDIVLLSHDLSEVIEDAVTDLKPQIAAKRHKLQTKIEKDLPSIFCDRKRLVQVLHNLVINASKYTPDGGNIKIEAARATTLGQIRISVADDGIGIPPSDHAHIFDTFFRASNVHFAGASGTGLGLNITRSLVELHGGDIWFESTAGKGTTFHVTFPCIEEA